MSLVGFPVPRRRFKFPIPMRGNEKCVNEIDHLISLSFPIPMRGNELHLLSVSSASGFSSRSP